MDSFAGDYKDISIRITDLFLFMNFLQCTAVGFKIINNVSLINRISLRIFVIVKIQ